MRHPPALLWFAFCYAKKWAGAPKGGNAPAPAAPRRRYRKRREALACGAGDGHTVHAVREEAPADHRRVVEIEDVERLARGAGEGEAIGVGRRDVRRGRRAGDALVEIGRAVERVAIVAD